MWKIHATISKKLFVKSLKFPSKNEVIRYDNYFKNMLEASFTIGAPF